MKLFKKNKTKSIKNLTIFSLIFNLFSHQSFATNSCDINTFNMEEANAILIEMSDKYKNFDNFKVKFKLIQKDPELGIIEENFGTFITSDYKNKEIENKYFLEFNNVITISDGETKWVYVKSINEVTITENNPEEDDEKFITKLKNIIMFPTEWLAPVLYEKKKRL